MSSGNSLVEAGKALRAARETHRPRRLSIRQAAERAGISEARWRQIEQGYELRSGIHIPVSTTEETLSRMALAVGLDPVEILTLAGMDPERAITESAAKQQLRQMIELAEQLPLDSPARAEILELRKYLEPPEEPLQQHDESHLDRRRDIG